MMNFDYIFPGENGFKGIVLDEYLSAGYYRMQHRIFTTHFTFLDDPEKGTPVFWLRTDLEHINENKVTKATRKKCERFEIIYKKAIITDEHEALYDLYRNHINFNTSATCSEYLHSDDSENPYDSWMIEIRDAGILVAVGFFDKGKEAISGIMNIYHPGYTKFSLGKYLMLKKIDHALANGIRHYYTGYISTSLTKFDYKLFPNSKAVEVFLPVEKRWVQYDSIGKAMLEAYFLNYVIG